MLGLEKLDAHHGEVGEVLVENGDPLVLSDLLGAGRGGGGGSSRGGRGGGLEKLTGVGDLGLQFALELVDCGKKMREISASACVGEGESSMRAVRTKSAEERRVEKGETRDLLCSACSFAFFACSFTILSKSLVPFTGTGTTAATGA